MMTLVDTSLGFKFEYRMSGGTPTIQKHTFKDTEKLYKGDLVNLESGEIDLAATGDTALLGIVNVTTSGTDSTTEVEVIVNPDAVYSVYDANARAAGALLDISGSAGAQTIAAGANNEFIVVAPSAADERTLVRINPASHAYA